MEVIFERGDWRYVIAGTIELNGKPDCRLQERNEITRRFFDAYLFDNQEQMFLAIEDAEYTKWLTGRPAYRHFN